MKEDGVEKKQLTRRQALFGGVLAATGLKESASAAQEKRLEHADVVSEMNRIYTKSRIPAMKNGDYKFDIEYAGVPLPSDKYLIRVSSVRIAESFFTVRAAIAGAVIAGGAGETVQSVPGGDPEGKGKKAVEDAQAMRKEAIQLYATALQELEKHIDKMK